ncbi:putative UDP-glucuronosyl/UDP-glucosyltransferase [Rosa chinensis]|uniref:Putative UDP-glucuronosyl/UDP-glucosyltransferase n=1 Tax=Rosa chinensis TaxID=74649 RepID=A0A2P6PM66_ROSCH|nr:putative UDP-glucuronosyl/UDP-glucosyltransferase [Rosa chinensis]
MMNQLIVYAYGVSLPFAFFPFMAQGHIIPAIHMAKIFVCRGLKVTVITTLLDAPFIHKKLKTPLPKSTFSILKFQVLKLDFQKLSELSLTHSPGKSKCKQSS